MLMSIGSKSLTSVALWLALATASPSLAQTPAPAQPPAAPTKWVPPVKGTAALEVIQELPKRVGSDTVTLIKVRNISTGSIPLLRVNLYWYDAKGNVVSNANALLRKQLQPGEIAEMSLTAPTRPGMTSSTFTFEHANGKIDLKIVKKFGSPTDKKPVTVEKKK